MLSSVTDPPSPGDRFDALAVGLSLEDPIVDVASSSQRRRLNIAWLGGSRRSDALETIMAAVSELRAGGYNPRLRIVCAPGTPPRDRLDSSTDDERCSIDRTIEWADVIVVGSDSLDAETADDYTDRCRAAGKEPTILTPECRDIIDGGRMMNAHGLALLWSEIDRMRF